MKKKTLPRKLPVVSLVAAFLGLAAYLGFQYYEKSATRRDEAAFQELALQLAQVVRAESPEPTRLSEAGRLLAGTLPYRGSSTEQLAMGAGAFINENLKEADARFNDAALLRPDSPDLHSFQAATNLRLGNTAKAEELYLKALALKSGAGYDSLLLSSDQLGLALCLFLLHRADEALPLAEQAWELRRHKLGPASSETISAANRLATVYVALGKAGEAERLLKQSYRDGLGDALANAAVLEETRLFLQTIAKSNERVAEMEHFLATAEAEPETEPETSSEPEAPPERKLEPVTAETLAEWEELARKMMGYDDALAADLLVRVIIGRQGFTGLDLYHPDLRPTHLDLVRAYMASARFGEAEEELRPLLTSVADRESEEFLELSAMMARIQEGAGRFKDAEAEWLNAAEVLDARLAAELKTKSGAGPATVSRMLNLHLQIAENILKQGKAAAEAELELRAALGRLNPRLVNTYPGTAEIYLRLARLLKGVEGRGRDSAEYYRRAKRAAETVLKRSPEPEVQAEMEALAAAATEESKPASRKKQPPQGEPAEAAEGPAEGPEKNLPEPEMLRLELSALAVLDRLWEFQPRMESILEEAAARYGEDSAAYMRYYSLKLKGLEEEGRTDELTRELLDQAAKPMGRDAGEQALSRSSALTYAARVNEKAGRKDMAVALYTEALNALGGQNQEPALTRRRLIEEALAALN